MSKIKEVRQKFFKGFNYRIYSQVKAVIKGGFDCRPASMFIFGTLLMSTAISGNATAATIQKSVGDKDNSICSNSVPINKKPIEYAVADGDTDCYNKEKLVVVNYNNSNLYSNDDKKLRKILGEDSKEYFTAAKNGQSFSFPMHSGGVDYWVVFVAKDGLARNLEEVKKSSNSYNLNHYIFKNLDNQDFRGFLNKVTALHEFSHYLYHVKIDDQTLKSPYELTDSEVEYALKKISDRHIEQNKKKIEVGTLITESTADLSALMLMAKVGNFSNDDFLFSVEKLHQYRNFMFENGFSARISHNTSMALSYLHNIAEQNPDINNQIKVSSNENIVAAANCIAQSVFIDPENANVSILSNEVLSALKGIESKLSKKWNNRSKNNIEYDFEP